MRVLTIAVIAAFVALILSVIAVAAQQGTSQDTWADTPTTTNMWRVISSGDVEELNGILETNPEYANVRAADGRGPLWWAYEYGKNDIIQALIKAGAKEDERDADGKTPKEVTSVGPTAFQQKQEAAGGAGGAAGGSETPKSGFDEDDDDM